MSVNNIREKRKVQLRAILFTFRIISLHVVGNGITVVFAFALRGRRGIHLGLSLRSYTANREADVPFCRAHGIHWGVSKRGKVRNMIPLGWHVQRSGIPDGRRGSKRSYKYSVRLVLLNLSQLQIQSTCWRHSDSTQYQILTQRPRSAHLLAFIFFANTWPSSKYAPIFLNKQVLCILTISSTGHRK